MYKVAVIGVGNIGYHHVRIYSKLNNASVVGVADVDEERGRSVAKSFGTKYYKDYSQLINGEKPHAVSIAVPTHLHKKVALDTIPFTKNLFIEKPIAGNMQDAKEIIRHAEKHGTKITVGYIERFNPTVLEVKKIIKRNTLGNIISISTTRVGLGNPADRSDVITDLATHDIDIAYYLLGSKPKLLYAIAQKTGGKRIDHAELILQIKDVNCFIHVNWITPAKIRNISITGTKGYLEANLSEQFVRIYKSPVFSKYKTYNELKQKIQEPKETRLKKAEPLKSELSHFLNSLSKNNERNDGTVALNIAEKALKFIKNE